LARIASPKPGTITGAIELSGLPFLLRVAAGVRPELFTFAIP